MEREATSEDEYWTEAARLRDVYVEPIERLLKVGVEQMKVVQRGNSLLVVWVTGPLIRLVSALLFALLVTRAGGMSEAEIRGTHASYALAAECREGDVAAEVCRVWKAAAHGSAISECSRRNE